MGQPAHWQAVIPLLSKFLCCMVLLTGQPAWAESRLALVIGNGDYEDILSLPNAAEDGRAMATALKRVGFEVFEGIDLDRREMGRLIQRFTRKLKGTDVALFYYAGHGLQFAGENYLVPTDATTLEDDVALLLENVPVKLVLDRLNRGANTKLVFLDACRDNPLTRSLARGMGLSGSTVGPGLARIEQGDEAFIAFATKPGAVALDGSGEHSPFTGALLAHLEEPGLELRDLMAKVRRQVEESTGNQQQPWETSSLTNEFYFKPEQPQVEVVKPTDSEDAGSQSPDLQITYKIWETIHTIRNPEQRLAALKRFVVQFPDSVLVYAAEEEIAELDTELRHQREMERLLEACGQYTKYSRLTEAATCYEQVLEKDRGSVAALRGLEQIIDAYASRAEDALERGLSDQSALYLDKIAKINPDHPRLLELRTRSSGTQVSRSPVVNEPPTTSPEQWQEAALRLNRSQRREIQRALTALGYRTRGADGVFGKNTRAAIRSYQRDRGHQASGYLTESQRRTIVEEAGPALRALQEAERQRQAAAEAEEQQRTVAATVTTLERNPNAIDPSEPDPNVLEVQQLLNWHGCNAPEDGLFRRSTAAALKRAGLPGNTMNHQTRAYLRDTEEPLCKQTVAATATTPERNPNAIDPSEPDPNVLEVQQLLNWHGCNAPEDGLFRRSTAAALKRAGLPGNTMDHQTRTYLRDTTEPLCKSTSR